MVARRGFAVRRTVDAFRLIHLPASAPQAPQEFFDRYPLDAIELPANSTRRDWSVHPAMEALRYRNELDEELDEATLRRAIATYYGLCSFMDGNVGQVLRAIDAAGLQDQTRIIYTSDHGEMMGEHGMWGKSTMYEASVGVPFIMAGPDLPSGSVVNENISLIDSFPTILDAVGAHPTPEDADLPGISLWPMARGEATPQRAILSEYHAAGSPTGVFMIRGDRYAYVHYVGLPPQLFDLDADPQESHDLGPDPRYASALVQCERELRCMVDPEVADAAAKAHQEAMIETHGGLAAVVAAGPPFVQGTPTPPAFFASARTMTSSCRGVGCLNRIANAGRTKMHSDAATDTPRSVARPMPRLPAFQTLIPGIVLGVAAVLLLIIVGYPLLWLALGRLAAAGPATLTHIAQAFTEARNFTPLKNTLILALGTGISSVVLGVPLAWATARTNMPLRRFIQAMVALSFITPPYLTSLAWIILLGPNAGHFNRLLKWLFHLNHGPLNIFGMGGVIFVIALHVFAFTYLLTHSALETLDAPLEESARFSAPAAGRSPAASPSRSSHPRLRAGRCSRQWNHWPFSGRNPSSAPRRRSPSCLPASTASSAVIRRTSRMHPRSRSCSSCSR